MNTLKKFTADATHSDREINIQWECSFNAITQVDEVSYRIQCKV